MRGERSLSPRVLRQLENVSDERAPGASAPQPTTLTPREREVMKVLAEAIPFARPAGQLGVSV